MRDPSDLIVFLLGGQRFAVRLAQVERVVAAAAVTPLPGAPDVVLGVFDLQGRTIAVYDAPRRFGVPAAPVRASEQFLVLHAADGLVALRVEQTVGVQAMQTLQPLPEGGTEWFEGITRLADGLVLIHDIDHFLTGGEARQLHAALEAL